MSAFNKALQEADSKPGRIWIKKTYWAKAHKTAQSRKRSAQQAADLADEMTPEELDRAQQAYRKHITR